MSQPGTRTGERDEVVSEDVQGGATVVAARARLFGWEQSQSESELDDERELHGAHRQAQRRVRAGIEEVPGTWFADPL